jgi:branched-chain amino acid aminotransferase
MPGTTVFLNGKFFGGDSQAGNPPIADARVSAFDAGLQHSVGLFETMTGGVSRQGLEGTAVHGEEVETWVLHMDEHLERLADSARALGLSDQLRTAALGEVVLETVRQSGLSRARIRLTLTGGDLAMLAANQGTAPRMIDPTIMIVAQPATAYPASMFNEGVTITLADGRANPLNPTEGHKTVNYWWRLRELQAAAAKGAGESLVLSVTNHVCSGCVSNVFVVKGDALLTPIARGEEEAVGGKTALPSPVLAGITRAWLLPVAERMGYTVKKQLLSVQDVLDAEEVFLTNSSWGVLPVVKIEANQIGAGKPGRLTLDLRDAWLDLLPGI